MSETPTPTAHPEVIAPPTATNDPTAAPAGDTAAAAQPETSALEAGIEDEASAGDAAGTEDRGDATVPAGDAEGSAAAPQAAAMLSPAAVAALLAQHFPALFGAGRALPIKLRIQADIQARAPGLVNKKSLSVFLHRYTTSTAYLKALATQAQRIDLDGAPAGDIEALHRDAALAEVERRKQMFEDRRALERDQQRAAAQEARRAQNAQAAARHAARDHAEGEARRNRALLLRAFETATLTKANFCALKGISESELDAQVALAKQEREQRALEPQRPANRNDHRDGPRREGRPPQRPDGPRGPRPPGGGRPAGGPPRGPRRGPAA
jgi:sRNA-binding protein